MKKSYIIPATTITRTELSPFMSGSERTYDSSDKGPSSIIPGFDGPITDAGSEDETAKGFSGSLWED